MDLSLADGFWFAIGRTLAGLAILAAVLVGCGLACVLWLGIEMVRAWRASRRCAVCARPPVWRVSIWTGTEYREHSACAEHVDTYRRRVLRDGGTVRPVGRRAD